MADYVDSVMNVYGKREDLEVFKENVFGEDDSALDFNKIIPMPEDVSAWDKNRKGDGWYYWQIEHWGVKWGAKYSSVTDMKGYLAYLFDTPWCGPAPIFEALVERYPSLDFDIITYNLEDYILLEMKTENEKYLKFSCYEHNSKKMKNGKYKHECIEHDVLKNTATILDMPRNREYTPLK